MKKIGFFVLMSVCLLVMLDAFGDAPTDSMQRALKQVTTKISTTFASLDQTLAEASKKLAECNAEGPKARAVLASLCKGRPYVFECTLIDTHGRLSLAEPAIYRNFEGRYVNFQAQVKELLKNKKPLLSPVFLCIEGADKIDFLYPIFNKQGKFLGALSLLISYDIILKDIIEPLVKGRPYCIWVKQLDGKILYDPAFEQTNKNIFSDSFFRPFKGLIALSESMTNTPAGEGYYDFYKKGLADRAIVKKVAVWETINLYGAKWNVVVVRDAENKPAVAEAPKS